MTGSGPVRVDVVRGPDACERVAGLWDELAERTGAPWFRTRQWVQAWSSTTGQRDLVVVTARSAAGTPRALLPLAWQRRRLHPAVPFAVRYLGIAGSGRGAGDRLGSLSVDPAARDAVAREAYAQAGRAPLLLENLAAAEASAFRRVLPLTVAAAVAGPLVPLGPDDPQAGWSKSLRAELRRMQRRMDEQGITARWVAPGADTEEAVRRLAELHARRWSARGHAGAFDEWRIRFVAAQAGLSDGVLGPWVRELTAPDGRTSAALLLFRGPDTAAYYQLGWDPEWAQLSPGKLLVADAIRWAHQEGLAGFDFLRGAEDYKYRLGGRDRLDYTLVSRRPAAKVLELRTRLRAGRTAEEARVPARPLDRALALSPLQPVARRRADRGLRILCYHGISDADRFRAQVEHLARSYDPVTLPEVLAALEGGARLPDRAVLVTFDDGVRSQFATAVPELDRVGVRAVFFLVMGALDTDRPFWWEGVLARQGRLGGFELGGRRFDDAQALVTALKTVPDRVRRGALARLDDELGPAPAVEQGRRADAHAVLAAGHAVGDHSWSHPLLDRCDDDTLRDEMDRSRAAFVEEFPGQPLVFAYPNGNTDARVEDHLRRGGYRAAFLFDHRVAAPGGDPLRISRLRVNEGLSAARFEIVLSGLHPTLMHLRSRVPRVAASPT